MITGDSAEYNLLAKWADQLSPRDFYLTVEIGVREGYGSDVIMENLKNRPNFHIGIDPYGDIIYDHVDMPPGTGDIQLTMSQKVPASGAVIITTPQDLALADAQKGIAMFNKVNVPVLGLIENMSYFLCGHCGKPNHVFGKDGAVKLAHRHGVPVLANIPLAIEIRESSEQGDLIAKDNEAQISETYKTAARVLASSLYYQQAHTSAVEIVITED